MALMECKDCQRQISTNADYCPQCGRPTRLDVRDDKIKEYEESFKTFEDEKQGWTSRYNSVYAEKIQLRKKALFIPIGFGMYLFGQLPLPQPYKASFLLIGLALAITGTWQIFRKD